MGCGVSKKLVIIVFGVILTDLGLLVHRSDACYLSQKRGRLHKPTLNMANFGF